MANFPDLVTTDIGIIAFWNALDHWVGPGANTIDPTNCVGIFDSYSVYDNGIEGYKALGSGRYFHARVKSDGWMVAWIDRTDTFAYPDKAISEFGEGANKGYYDILWNWFTKNVTISNTQTTLSYLISLLYNALSNSGDFSYADADVGHYCYEYPDTSVLTLMDLKATGNTSKTGNVKYTSGTTLYYAAVTGYAVATNIDSRIRFAGHDIAAVGLGTNCGVADIKAEGWMPNPLTDYPLNCFGRTGTCYVHGSILILWE